VDHARETAKEILKTHRPEPLAEDLQIELARLVSEAEKNISH